MTGLFRKNSNSNLNPKSKTFLGKWGEGWSFYGALECISSDMHLSASRALDILVVVIDGMTFFLYPIVIK